MGLEAKRTGTSSIGVCDLGLLVAAWGILSPRPERPCAAEAGRSPPPLPQCWAGTSSPLAELADQGALDFTAWFLQNVGRTPPLRESVLPSPPINLWCI